MTFTKMQAYGNDYVYIDTLTQELSNLNELAKFVSKKHFGVCSDGMILVCPSDVADFRMRVFNPDGTEAEMCGNALRSVGMLVFEKGFTDKTEITVETLGGLKKIYLTLSGGHVSNITANIGAPIIEADKVPAITKSECFIDKTVILDGRKFDTTAISLGNPHCVSFVSDLDDLDLEKYGPLMENNQLFPNRINAEFCEVRDRSHLRLRTWERGTGETLACATGCATCIVGGVLTDRCDRKVDVEQIGGVTQVEWRAENNSLYITAPSNIVFDGTLHLPHYLLDN
ncbi:MAG: diaminopimelate epimerase [Ruminococcaceae bacterium]|nr:diaminopimelate epimerase [Oscillospiraceae bacterium]